MIVENDGASTREESDPALAALAEQITRQLQSGEAVDIDDYARKYPAWAASIRGLLPTLHQLVELGQSVAASHQARRPGKDVSP